MMSSKPHLRALLFTGLVSLIAACGENAGESPKGVGGAPSEPQAGTSGALLGAGTTNGGSEANAGANAVPEAGANSAGGAPANTGGAATSGGNGASAGVAGSSKASGGAAASAGSSGNGGSGGRGGGGSSGSSVPAPVCAKTTCTTCGPSGNKHNLNNDNWAGSLTLFISYSSDTRTQTVDKGFTAAQWNAAVNSFDVPGFAAQVRATGAKNILLMLGQNTGFYCSPNSAYEKYAGVAPGTRASTRDLPMEIADALLPMGIGMYLYLPEDVGWGDKEAAKNFGLSALALNNWVVDSTFTPKWNEVVKTWANRYGTKVKGWFFDGYDSRWGVTQAMGLTYRNTCLAANPCGVVLLNGANGNNWSDAERGETRINAATGLPAKGLPTSRWTNSDLQTMWAFPLQAAWGQAIADNSPAIYSNDNLSKFIAAAVKAQTVFALDVRTSFGGKLSTPIYNQLVAVKTP